MLHFLWLGAALLLIAAITRRALRRAGPNVRYAHSLGTLLILAALPLATAMWLDPSPRSGGEGLGAGAMSLADGKTPTLTLPLGGRGSDLPPPEEEGRGGGELTPQFIELNPNYNAQQNPPAEPVADAPVWEGEAPAEPSPGTSVKLGRSLALPGRSLALPWRTTLHTLVPYLPYLWLLGTPLTFALLATGLIGAERMRRHGTPLTAGPLHETCERLRRSLRITRRVTLAVCDRVAQPVLVGIVRPLILLPPVALTGWSPAEIEMVLLHELAHVRRWDNLVNLAQRVIESLLFFHPAVWIASTWVRRDREECCDAVVVTRTREPKQYAELLIALASPQPLAGPSLVSTALATHPLAARLRRILKLEDEPMLVSRNTIGLLALAVVAIALVVVSGPLRVLGEDQPAEEATASDPPPPSSGEGLGEGETADQPPTREPSDTKTAVYVIPSDQAHLREFLGDLANRQEIGIIDVQGNKITVTGSQAQHDKLNEMLPGIVEDRSSRRETSVDVTATGSAEGPLEIKPTTDSSDARVTIFEIPREKHKELENLLKVINLGEQARLKIISDYLQVVTPSEEHERVASIFKLILGDPVQDGQRVTRAPLRANADDPFAGNPPAEPGADGAIIEPFDPLADVAYATPDDKRIALEAWHTLRLKLAPATDAEREIAREHGYEAGLRIVTLTNEGNGSVILAAVESSMIRNFADLEIAIGRISFPLDTVGTVTWTGVAEKRGKLRGVTQGSRLKIEQEYVDPNQPRNLFAVAKAPARYPRVYKTPGDKRPGPEELEKWLPSPNNIKVESLAPDDPRLIITATKTEHERIAKVLTDVSPQLPFLSLVDQKIADRAYKLLGVELEPLTQEELAIIAHHGFKSGLRVANMRRESGLIGGDLLVGLHVWPTTDLNAVDAILSRDDLAQLDPLKYYVVRHPAADLGRGGFDGRAVQKVPAESYSVRSGRIHMELPKPTKVTEGSRDAVETGDPYGPRNVPRAPDPTPTPAPPTMFNPPALIVPPTASTLPGTYSAPQPVLVLPEAGPRPTRADDRQPARSSAALPWNPPTAAPQLAPTQAPVLIRDPDEPHPQPVLHPSDIGRPNIPIPQSEIRNPQSATPVYRYDGKTFQTWRDEWKHELSTEKRIEAVRALAAFARAGHAKEAAEAILDVAAEYDVQTMDTQLRDAIMHAFGVQIRLADWEPLLRERYKADAAKWEPIAASILAQSRPANNEERALKRQFLLDIAHQGTQAQYQAFDALANLDPQLADDEIRKLVLDGLKSDNPHVVVRAMMAFARSGSYPPEVLDLLLQGEAQQQQNARRMLRNGGAENVPLVDKLLEILRDEERQSDHLAAIRALSGPWQVAAETDAIDVLQEKLPNMEDPKLQVAAAVAVQNITNQSIQALSLLTGRIKDDAGQPLSDRQLPGLISEEESTVFGDQR